MRARGLLIWCVLSLSGTALAGECQKNGLLLFPTPGSVIPTNAQFILEGAGTAQQQVQDLLTSDAIALVARGQEPIQVKAEKGYVSQMSRVALRLRPLKPMEPNVEYSLALPSSFAGIPLLTDKLGDGTLRWLTGPGADKKTPRYRQKPASSEGFYVVDKAGGLTRKLKLRTLVEESGPTFFLVSMQRARGSSARQEYPVMLEGDTLTLGHDACSGNFGFDDGRAYKLTFELYDAAGNRSSEKAALEVAAPRALK